MVWGHFAVHMQTCSFPHIFRYFNVSYILLDSQRRMLYDDMIYVNVENEIEVYNKHKLKICNFQYIFLN